MCIYIYLNIYIYICTTTLRGQQEQPSPAGADNVGALSLAASTLWTLSTMPLARYKETISEFWRTF